MSANERQVGGSHYKRSGKLQHWDLMAECKADYFQGQITKYTDRHKSKNGRQDLEKALHFAEKWHEIGGSLPCPIFYRADRDHLISKYLLESNLTLLQHSIFRETLLNGDKTQLVVDLCRAHLESEYPTEVGPGTPEDGGHYARAE